ncbi:hypothetical protein FHT86_004185 [Rhizobium sp. BK313]|uniref:hypothetical protein n=1 Tax=Rhizobium sp. BK313 TaxID=2587081 RepID=UPI00105F5A5B|nr:hypothetical protein [Rhizobium sp. BK313]MBB3455886.1 hypothetical protein [Rhizobium sp. BK313]
MQDMLKQQAALQAEADAIVKALDLDGILRIVGNPVRVGSSALGLMVRRDIDVTVICEKLDRTAHVAIAQIAGQLMLHPCIGAVRFRNDSDFWNKTPEDYPDGLYLGISYRSANNDDWNFDVWFVDEPERQPDLKHLQTILPRLSTAMRETILTIKTILATGSYTKPVSSSLVYEAVLDGGVSSVAEFESWLRQRP